MCCEIQFKKYWYSSTRSKLQLEAENSSFNLEVKRNCLSSVLLSSLCAYKNALSNISGVIALRPLTVRDHPWLLRLGQCQAGI